MTIYVVRHGETAGNASGVVQFPETPLNDRGLAQAGAVGARLADAGITRILVSDYARAHATAEKIAATTGRSLQIHTGLRERNFGDLRGRPRSEVGELMHDETFEPPNGESWAVFNERVGRCWVEIAEIAKSTPGNLAVVTHGLVCVSLCKLQFSLPGEENVPAGFGNTSVTVVESVPPWQVSLLNCTEHLDAAIDARGFAL